MDKRGYVSGFGKNRHLELYLPAGSPILFLNSLPVKINLPLIRLLSFLAALVLTKPSLAQGKVVINEYMPWASNGCGTTSEFVELLNFGPGPVDIGCYILTTGVYSVTVPKNTVIYPGQFYVIAGQNFISGSCANVDSSSSGVHVNLNWSTCNCTNVPIPATGDGMMKDGGNSNTPLALLDPSLNIVDAVVRNTPTEATQTITTASMPGACTGKTFNLSTLNPTYEVLGMSAGRGNSFARELDGDCIWVKDPQQSANATNNRSGQSTDISYGFNMVNPTSCDEFGKGSVSIYVNHSNYAAVFPMSYILAQDLNNDGIFDGNDQYGSYTDNDAPFVKMDDLPMGHFKATVSSKTGCYLKTFEFTIISCNPGTLPVKLVYFKNKGTANNQHHLEWLLQEVQNLQSMVLEKSKDGKQFVADRILTSPKDQGTKLYTEGVAVCETYRHYRLKVTANNGKAFFSAVVHTANAETIFVDRVWPNPATDKLYVERTGLAAQKTTYTLYNSSGLNAGEGVIEWKAGETKTAVFLPTVLRPGIYQLQAAGLAQPFSFRFVKR